jgi:hypothetical protein
MRTIASVERTVIRAAALLKLLAAAQTQRFVASRQSRSQIVTSNSTHEGSIVVDDETDSAFLRRRQRLHVFDLAGKSVNIVHQHFDD